MYKCTHLALRHGGQMMQKQESIKVKNWINEKDLEKALGSKNLAGNKTKYYSDELTKRRHEMQDCEHYQPCRKFIAEELAIYLILDTKTVQTGELLTNLIR